MGYEIPCSHLRPVYWKEAQERHRLRHRDQRPPVRGPLLAQIAGRQKTFPQCLYVHTQEECKEKLKVLIVEMKAEIAEAKRRMDLGQGGQEGKTGKE